MEGYCGSEGLRNPVVQCRGRNFSRLIVPAFPFSEWWLSHVSCMIFTRHRLNKEGHKFSVQLHEPLLWPKRNPGSPVCRKERGFSNFFLTTILLFEWWLFDTQYMGAARHSLTKIGHNKSTELQAGLLYPGKFWSPVFQCGWRDLTKFFVPAMQCFSLQVPPFVLCL